MKALTKVNAQASNLSETFIMILKLLCYFFQGIIIIALLTEQYANPY